MRFVFVILHYISFIDTIECIESIKKLTNRNIKIVVVDNKSPNDSGDLLLEKYKHDKTIYVLKNDENVGFAKGNNIGIEFAVREFNPDFVICVNSDTVLCQCDFLDRIQKEFNQSNFWVLGPMIYTADGKYTSNPLRSWIKNLDEATIMLRAKKKELFYVKSRLNIFQFWWWKLKKKIINYRERSPLTSLVKKANIPIHGSCVIFSKLFFENMKGFNPNTFLYQEENILYHEVIKKSGIIIYCPEIIIFHKEDSSVNAMKLDNRKKKIFMIENEIHSLYVLIDVLQNR